MVRNMPLLLVGALGALLSAASLEVGNVAPDFTLAANTGKDVRLSDYKGRTVVLAFFVKAFTGG